MGKIAGYGIGWISEAVLAQALCGEMQTLEEYPLYLRARWADIGGMPPPARMATVTGATERATGGQASSGLLRKVEFEAVEMANAGSGSTSGPKTREMEPPKRREIENSRSGPTSGPLCFAKKVVCGADLESKVVEETKVDSELPDLRGPWRRRSWKAGLLRSELSHLPAVLEAPKVKKCRQLHCHVCHKEVSRSNMAKHMRRIHPGFHRRGRGRPKVLRGGVDVD